MTEDRVFSDHELAQRLGRTRERMAVAGLDGLIVAKPENIFYLTGLDHQGYFAPHLLVVPAAGEMTLIARAMERVTIEDQVQNAAFRGYGDGDDPAQVVHHVLRSQGLAGGRWGIERSTLFLPPAIHDGIVAAPGAMWVDAARLIDDLRLIKSPREIELTRAAARVSRAMMRAAIDAARPGVNEREVAAEVQRAMILEGGEPPGFGPFIRPTPRLGQEHGTWRDRALVEGEALFVELSGCVGRYHAPMGRLLWLGQPASRDLAIGEVCREALQRVVAAIGPGTTAAEVYRAWQSRVDEAGLAAYRRHHCGYLVGIGFPPSWTGGSEVVGLRHDSDLVLRPGMVFHLLSWLMGTGRGDAFASDATLLGEERCEVLTRDPDR